MGVNALLGLFLDTSAQFTLILAIPGTRMGETYTYTAVGLPNRGEYDALDMLSGGEVF